MLVIPFSDNPRTYKLFVVLEDDGIERIKEFDPAQIQLPLPGFNDLVLERLFIGYANEEVKKQILDCVSSNAVGRALALLSSGSRFRPELGDYDGPPLSLKPKEGEAKQ